MYVAPHAKGRGIGRALMGELIAEAQCLGFRQIVAVIGDGRPEQRVGPSARGARLSPFGPA